jgi:hypothetical protein
MTIDEEKITEAEIRRSSMMKESKSPCIFPNNVYRIFILNLHP